jgi:hypothetical protein
MKRATVLGAVIVVVGLVTGVHREDIVTSGGHAAHVLRAPGDNLDDVTTQRIAFSPREALAGCTSWDVKDNCCPAGCAAKKGTNWSKADDIFRGCMRGLGCGESDVKGATVFMKCDCK